LKFRLCKSKYDETSVRVEASHFNSRTSQFGVNEVDTTHFFSTEDTQKVRDDMLNWVRQQSKSAGFTTVIEISNLMNPLL